MTELCKFSKGSCIHCGDTKQGECEGWNQPPKREWAGLTDEQVAEIERMSTTRSQAIRAIDAKLKELNHEV